mgnify:CR=1 FL=1
MEEKQPLPGVKVHDLSDQKRKPGTITQLPDREVKRYFDPLGFRLVKNEGGVIEFKKGFGVDAPTIIFDMNERTTQMKPMAFAKSIANDHKLSFAIHGLMKKLA